MKRLKILAVDDSEEVCFLIGAYLAGTRHEVAFAGNGEAAVEIQRSQDFDVILMDIQMPRMNGLAATRAIRVFEKRSGSARAKIIALTANEKWQDIAASRRAGCDAHLVKPITQAQLLRVIGQEGPETEAFLEDIRPGYLANRKEELAEMFALLSFGDFERLAVLGHNIKGTGRAYGFADISRIGESLEYSAKRKDMSAARSSVEELSSYLAGV